MEGGYSQFLEKKEEFLLAQSNRQEALANRVRREVEWLRRGPKARTGKSQGADRRCRAADPRAVATWNRAAAKGVDADRFHRHRPAHQAAALGGRRSRKRWAAARCSATSPSRSTPGTRLGLAGTERHGQDHAAADPGGRDRAGCRHGRARRRRCASVYFDQTREQLDRVADAARGAGRARRSR